MKPIYLILLVLMACGFFACTTDYATDATEISPAPEGKLLNATSFAVFTSDLEEFGIFDEELMTGEDVRGVEDIRLYLDEDGPTVDFLTDNDGLDDDRTLEEITALRPVRNWASSIAISFKQGDPERFQRWLTDNFSDNEFVDLRFTLPETGKILISGLLPTKTDLEQFQDVPLFGSGK